MDVILQNRRQPRLIFNIIWSGLNTTTDRKAPLEVIYIGGTLNCIIWRMLTTNPCLGPVYLGKLDLSDAYMRIWVMAEDTPSVAFLLPKKQPEEKQLVVFHLSLTMELV